MIYYILALMALVTVFWGLARGNIFRTCPICAAAATVWIGGLALLYLNRWESNPMILAILMGSSLGAIAERYGKRFGALWKTSTVLLGLPAIYFLVTLKPWWGLSLAGAAALVTLAAMRKPTTPQRSNSDIFQDCCS